MTIVEYKAVNSSLIAFSLAGPCTLAVRMQSRTKGENPWQHLIPVSLSVVWAKTPILV
jgi:hypothetical protein